MYTGGIGRVIASQFMDGLSFSREATTKTMDENNVPQNEEEVVKAPEEETEAAEPAGDEGEAA